MAYPQLRSMNAALFKGSVESSYKQLYPDRECVGPDEEAHSTYHNRDELSLLYYGYGMKEVQDSPAGPKEATPSGYYRNRLAREAQDGPVLGRAW